MACVGRTVSLCLYGHWRSKPKVADDSGTEHSVGGSSVDEIAAMLPSEALSVIFCVYKDLATLPHARPPA